MAQLLHVDNVSVSFDGFKAINALSFDIGEGELRAIIGPNGAGKTTLIRQIYGSEAPDSGSISLCGVSVTGFRVPQRIKLGIGRSFQISNVLMGFSVLENAVIAEQARIGEAFRFFRPAFSDRQLIEGGMKMLSRVGIEQRSDVLVADLAHGERRLLELAIAMSSEPALLLLDEPMAGAGSEESQHMIEIIDQLRCSAGILLIEHDMDAVFRLADRVTVLVEGVIIASGTPAEISSNKDVRAAYLWNEDAEA